MWWLIWIITIIVSFLITRESVKRDEDFFNDVSVGLYIIFGLIPFINVVIYSIFLGMAIYYESDLDSSDIVKKIFFIKDKE